jgi:uncharacterized protein (TIGR02646 family)
VVELEHKLPEPTALAAHRSRSPDGPWDSISNRLEKIELRHQLHAEQDSLCIYCESSLGQDEGHVEHIVSRHADPSLTFVYANLAHSCDAHAHCGHHKDKRVIPIEPRRGCSAYFELSVTTGRLAPNRRQNTTDQTRAETTLDVLGLNRDPGLVRRRQKQAKTAIALELQSPTDALEYLATAPFRWSLRRIVA